MQQLQMQVVTAGGDPTQLDFHAFMRQMQQMQQQQQQMQEQMGALVARTPPENKKYKTPVPNKPL